MCRAPAPAPVPVYKPGDLKAAIPQVAKIAWKESHPGINVNAKERKSMVCKICGKLVSETKLALIHKTHDIFGGWLHLSCVRLISEDLDLIKGSSQMKEKERLLLLEKVVRSDPKSTMVKLEAEAEPQVINEEDQIDVNEMRWDQHKDHIIENIYRIPKESSYEIAKTLGIELDTFRLCVKYYFEKELLISPEVKLLREQHSGNQLELFRGGINQDQYKNDLMLTLHEAVQVVSLTKGKTFSKISVDHNMSGEDVQYYVNMVISFGMQVLGGQNW